ncbi:serine/threonine-protein kinase [Streptomyces anandii]|uniref:serine/threonine-protein kinase n=1 Tax=Streptomyces anandii TaxID=285454 RepID=UPI001677075E|nr:serine/threonine-protein kinase [Streptomyces anandii]GGX85588.1 serine/threonine protein kinase [Streptomyces anandii JCM 4720]
MSGGVPGLLVAGRYRLAESIGQGGMGRVWRAVDEILHRRVAVKEMRIDGVDQEDSRTRRERTLREARATARIDHPGVVRVYDVVDEGERLWIVMELVPARSLERLLADDGPLSPGETARIGLGLVSALRQVHAVGVLHRDIKPGNVLVESGGGRRVVLTDFGIAAIQDAKALTMVGMLVGSPDYMAPERVSGRPQGPPSDVWSLGATLCAALVGRSPFSRDTTLATLHAVLYEEPRLPPAAGPLSETLAALLVKDPEARPALDALESALRPVAYPPPTPTLAVPGPTRVSHGPGGTGPASTPMVGPGPGPEPGQGPAPSPAPESAPAPERAPARPAGRGHRPWLRVAAGVLVAGAVLGAVLALLPDGTAERHDSSTGTAGSSASVSPSASPSSSPTVEGTSRPPSVPPGAHREAGGFAWATPKGWRRDVKTGAEVHYTSPDGGQELAAKSSLARGDLMETWRTSEQNAHQGQDYRKIRLERTTFHGRPAVVWEYTFTLGGAEWHARLLGFDADGKSYQVNTWYRPDGEPRALATYERVKDSFTVL